ncbi:MAG: hypothetical protein KatS3mg111_3798 [Pirellulaceae bacterium]|nr:MAG: hypothetical protein KatS3mg111_3798 [Pirellulaceae bacterium]
MSSSVTDKTRARTALAIHVRFITDRCVAAAINDRDQPEWPPHPGRLFMALAAAHFETDGPDEEKAAERAALEWLERLPPPRLRARSIERRRGVTCYVPVNDRPAPNKAMLQSAPGMPRSRQSRTFPTVVLSRVGFDDMAPDVSFFWEDISDDIDHFAALERLCSNVIRIGHSSSLVMVWAEQLSRSANGEEDFEADDEIGVYVPTSERADTSARIATEGELQRLRDACRADEIEQFAALKELVESTTGKSKREAKAQFQKVIGVKYGKNVRPPEPTPPVIGVWQGYRRVEPAELRPVHSNSYFDRDLIILAKMDGPMLSVERTIGLTNALRKTAIECAGGKSAPAWLSGHEPDDSRTTQPHAAFLALPFAGHEHADGHVMGLAIALPHGVSLEERGRWLGPLLVNDSTGQIEPKRIALWARDFPDWTVQLEDRLSPPRMLQIETWTRPSTTWASVTPVVLDRFPKASRVDERSEWQREVEEIVAVSCTRAGLPQPVEVDVDSTCWHRGIPRAWTKTRRLRPPVKDRTETQLGDGFPNLPPKPSRPVKPQVHVWLRFDCPVAGPVIVGAGRFQGYGLCLPIRRQPPQ